MELSLSVHRQNRPQKITGDQVELERLRFRDEFLSRLLKDEDPDSIFASICSTLARVFRGGQYAIVDRTAPPRNWQLRASAGLDEDTLAMLQDTASRPELTRLGWRMLQRGPMRIEKPRDSSWLRAGELDLASNKGLWIQPILGPGWVVTGAVICTFDRGLEFNILETELLIVAAEVAGMTLERLHTDQSPVGMDTGEAVLDGVTALLLVVDMQGRIVQVNRAFERVFGRESGELYGSNLDELLADPEDTSLSAWLEAIGSGTKGVQYEGRWRTAEGHDRWVGWVGAGIRDRRGRLSFIVCTGADITDRRRAEREREQVHQALLHLQKMEAIEVLVDGYVHDFNNNLTAIIGFADLAHSSLEEDHPARSSMEAVLDSAKLATSLTGSLLSFTRSAGVHRGECAVGDVLESCSQLLAHALPKSIEIEVDFTGAREHRVVGDPNQIRQVLVALTLNARDAMPQGGSLVIRSEARTFEPDQPLGGQDVDQSQEYVALIVEDTGTGISEDLKARIFQPFFTTKLRGRGSGLGLPGVQRIMQEHDGFIEIDSVEDEGTTVTVLFPAFEAQDQDQPENQECVGRVVVADVEGLSRSVVVTSLRNSGFDISVASGLPEVLGTGILENVTPHLLILDAKSLPADWEECFEELWRRAPEQRVLIMGREHHDTGDRPLLSCLPRPFTMGQLTRTVQEHLHPEERT